MPYYSKATAECVPFRLSIVDHSKCHMNANLEVMRSNFASQIADIVLYELTSVHLYIVI